MFIDFTTSCITRLSHPRHAAGSAPEVREASEAGGRFIMVFSHVEPILLPLFTYLAWLLAAAVVAAGPLYLFAHRERHR